MALYSYGPIQLWLPIGVYWPVRSKAAAQNYFYGERADSGLFAKVGRCHHLGYFEAQEKVN